MAVGPVSQAVDEGQRDLGLVVPVGLEMFVGDAELGRHLRHTLHGRLLGDFDVR
jgi:hypothetical protein